MTLNEILMNVISDTNSFNYLTIVTLLSTIEAIVIIISVTAMMIMYFNERSEEYKTYKYNDGLQNMGFICGVFVLIYIVALILISASYAHTGLVYGTVQAIAAVILVCFLSVLITIFIIYCYLTRSTSKFYKFSLSSKVLMYKEVRK